MFMCHLGIFLFKGLEDIFQILLTHANAGIGDFKGGHHHIAGMEYLPDDEFDFPFFRRKFHRVGENIHEYLLNAHGIPDYMAMRHLLDVNHQVKLFLFQLPIENRLHLRHDILQRKFLVRQFHFALLNGGQIQNIVD